jgi:tRNA A-37 threonylcarbamoyl transferase component Bud32
MVFNLDLKPFHAFRHTTNTAYVATIDGQRFFVKCYRGKAANERRKLEQKLMNHWYKNGFNVPANYDISIAGLEQPYLVIEFIEGTCLAEYLTDALEQTTRKLDTIARILDHNYIRHQQALATGDIYLIHSEPHMSNLMISAKGCYYIDFESPLTKRPMLQAIATEIAKFSRWASTDIGCVHTDAVVKRVLKAYQKAPAMIEALIALTIDRPFQWGYRWRDRIKKRKNPFKVSKYDIIDAIAQQRKGE